MRVVQLTLVVVIPLNNNYIFLKFTPFWLAKNCAIGISVDKIFVQKFFRSIKRKSF